MGAGSGRAVMGAGTDRVGICLGGSLLPESSSLLFCLLHHFPHDVATGNRSGLVTIGGSAV